MVDRTLSELVWIVFPPSCLLPSMIHGNFLNLELVLLCILISEVIYHRNLNIFKYLTGVYHNNRFLTDY
jgi:hypothetical protein